MPLVTPKGSVSAPLWFVFETPYGSDVKQGQLLSGGMGFVFEKMLREAGINSSDCYFTSRAPDTDTPLGFINIDGMLEQHKPPLIVAVDNVCGWFFPQLREKNQGLRTSKGQLNKYAGSLLSCEKLTYPHYMMPLYGSERCVADWTERNITTYVDLQKLRDELLYWKANKQLKPLLSRTLKYDDLELDELLFYLERFRSAKLLSNDIENPVWNSKRYSPHPGYPFLIGLADSKDFGISFKLFRDTPAQNRALFKKLYQVFSEVPILGQNFFNYDALFEEACGFRIKLESVQDTLIRHHVLWPELSHKLQFMTRQYTREPYYKDEGHSWSFKYLNRYRRYNALDATVTMEIYEQQEEEFNLKPHLR